jgi:hypothetical protein
MMRDFVDNLCLSAIGVARRVTRVWTGIMKDDRFDIKLDAVVNKGLAAALLNDVSAGIKIMKDGGVPPEIVTRVFLEPQHRRASDWKR